MIFDAQLWSFCRFWCFVDPKLRNVGIDYATNTIDAILGKYYISIFYFKDYDINLNNRWVDYTISWGEAGIIIKFKATKDYSDRITRKEQIEH
jgi:hypothetical protein